MSSADPGPMLTEREMDRAAANAAALSRALAPNDPVLRKRIRNALCDAYVAGVRRDAAKDVASL